MLRKLRRTKSLSGSLDVFGKTDLGKVRAGNEDFKEVLIAGERLMELMPSWWWQMEWADTRLVMSQVK